MRGTRREGPCSQAENTCVAVDSAELKTQAEQQPLFAECLPRGRNSTYTDLFHLCDSVCIWHYYPHLTYEETEVQGVEQTVQMHNQKRQFLDLNPGLSIPCACATSQLSVSRRSSILAVF